MFIAVKNLRYIIVFAIAIIALSVWVNFSDASNSNKDASRFVAEMTDQVMKIVANENLSEIQKSNELKVIFNKIVDVKWIGRFAMGKHWRLLSDPQKQLFMNIYPNYLTKSYVKNFKEMNNNAVKVNSVNSTAENEYMVFTTITNKLNNSEVNVNFRLIYDAKADNTFKVFDIIAEGVSLISTQRNEFNEIMSKPNGFEELVKRIKQQS